ncbi:MAG: nucleotide exchange factor GrpE [Candidatus Micrarchaeia archaeon]
MLNNDEDKSKINENKNNEIKKESNKNNNYQEDIQKKEEKNKQESEDYSKETKDSNEEEKKCRERILQLTAEFDNYKKRVSKDILIAKQTGKADLVKELLLILDEFELALIAIKKTNDENIIKGVELLYSNLIDTLKRNGLTEIKTDGIYNPYFHEIILVQEDNTKKDGTIISVVKKGYMLNDILLRAAAVIVAKNNIMDTTKEEQANNKQEGNDKKEDAKEKSDK